MDAESNYFAFVVAYIDSDFIEKVDTQLAKHKLYEEIEAFIPTIKVLKKKFKNQQFFENVPLLFQYGFFKIPRKYAVHALFLDTLKDDISAIYGWVKDPLKASKKAIDLESVINRNIDHDIPVATATSKEISDLIKATINLGAHSAEDLDLLKPGDFIILKGYPYEGMDAEFMKLDRKKKKVVVKLILFNQTREVEVSFDNVFFNLYQNKGYDDSITIQNHYNNFEMAEKKFKQKGSDGDKPE